MLLIAVFAPSLFYCKASNESTNPTLSLTLAPHIYFISKLFSFMITICLNDSGQMEMQMEFSTENCRSKFIISHIILFHLMLIICLGILWNAFEFACFHEFQISMRWFLGSQSASETLERELVVQMLALLVPRCHDHFRLDALFSEHEADFDIALDKITQFRHLLLLSDATFLEKLESESFRSFITRLRDFELAPAQRPILRSIVEQIDLKPPQTPNPKCSKVRSTELPLSFHQVLWKTFTANRFDLHVFCSGWIYGTRELFQILL